MIEPQQRIFLLDQTLWVLSSPTGISVYDFEFESFLPCLHPWQRPETILAVARIGAFENYEVQYQPIAVGWNPVGSFD